MPKICVIGGGIGGLTTGMLLAKDGHDVVVLERDPAPPPAAGAEAAWDRWERRGVNQFRLLHFFNPRFRKLLEAELPEAAAELEKAGALRLNFFALIPDEMKGGTRPGDEDFTVLTARRPVAEAALAAAAAATPRLEIRRGVAVTSLARGDEVIAGVPHVVGVVTDGGEEIRADLIADATGRRSPLPRWLDELGAPPMLEEAEDSGFVYYGRHFRSSDGSVPAMLGGLIHDGGSISIITLPADNGTWGIGVITSAKDTATRALRDVDRWTATVKSFPLVAHWLDGEPIEPEIVTMAKIEDRYRRMVVAGRPSATGVVMVADSWACTNPSLGRGAALALLHSVELRNTVRRLGLDDPAAFALAWDDATEAVVAPWYRATVEFDRHRLAEAEALARGEQYVTDDPSWEITHALMAAARKDPDVLRAMMSVVNVLALPDEVLARPGVLDRVIALGAGWRDDESLAPTRHELEQLVGVSA